MQVRVPVRALGNTVSMTAMSINVNVCRMRVSLRKCHMLHVNVDSVTVTIYIFLIIA
jgi:hypothetical protein